MSKRINASVKSIQFVENGKGEEKMNCSKGAFRVLVVAATLATSMAYAKAADAPAFSAVAINFAETLRLYVVNFGNLDVPPGPCTVEVNFVNAAGQVIKTSNLTVDVNRTAWTGVNFVEASRATSATSDSLQRQILRPVIGALAPPCRVTASAEVFDTVSGKTGVYVPAVFLPAIQNTVAGTN